MVSTRPFRTTMRPVRSSCVAASLHWMSLLEDTALYTGIMFTQGYVGHHVLNKLPRIVFSLHQAPPIEKWPFYIVLSFFRAAAIIAGVQARALKVVSCAHLHGISSNSQHQFPSCLFLG